MNRNNDNRKSFDSFEQLSFQNNNCTIRYWYKAGSGENITLKMIPNAGHCVNMDNPEAVNKHISEFINE